MTLPSRRTTISTGRHSGPIIVFLISVIGGLFGPTQSAYALSFNLIFDASTNGAPAGFLMGFNEAVQFYQTNFTDPITINLQVGWGEVAGQTLPPGLLGEGSASQPGFFQYGTIKSVLVADAKSAADLTSIANMPASDPTNNATFKISRAQGKALGLTIGDGSALDGAVGFNSTALFTFDPNNRAVAGKIDFIGVAEHEVSEVMGRFGLGQNGASSGRYGPIDLFRYLSPGMLDLVPANGAYFSIDGGKTVINTFNGTGGGDLSDWSGATFDSYNASLATGVKLGVSTGDLLVMDAIGYDRLIPGDFNRDGQVTVADLPLMFQALTDLAAYQTQKGLTDSQMLLLGDINQDYNPVTHTGGFNNGDIQAMLYLLIHRPSAAAAVPEPSSFVLGAIGLCSLAFALSCRPVGR